MIVCRPPYIQFEEVFFLREIVYCFVCVAADIKVRAYQSVWGRILYLYHDTHLHPSNFFSSFLCINRYIQRTCVQVILIPTVHIVILHHTGNCQHIQYDTFYILLYTG
jgi:hypothetical protein